MDLHFRQLTEWNITLWAFFAIACALSSVRYTVQRQKYDRLQYDDWIHIATLLQCLVFVIVASAQLSAMVNYWYLDPSDTSTWEDNDHVFKILGALNTTFLWSTVFSSKAVFLALYRRLFGISRHFRFFWWSVVIFQTVAFTIGLVTYISMGTIWCNGFEAVGSEDDDQAPGCEDYEQRLRTTVLIYAICNITTDFLVIILPIGMVFRLQTRPAHLGRLIGIFTLGLVVTIFDILGWVFDLHGITEPLVFIKGIEPQVAVIISALPPLAHLLNSKDEDSDGGDNNSYYNNRHRMSVREQVRARLARRSMSVPSRLLSESGSTNAVSISTPSKAVKGVDTPSTTYETSTPKLSTILFG